MSLLPRTTLHSDSEQSHLELINAATTEIFNNQNHKQWYNYFPVLIIKA
jgi:hypothetical protein